MQILTIVRRAFTSNLRLVSPSTGERASLEASGIHEPAIQRYFAWRRSIVLIVVLSTVLSAGLATFREFTETDNGPNVVDVVSEKILADANRFLPAASLQAGFEDDSFAEDETVKTGPTTARSAGADAASQPDDDDADDEPQTAFGRFADAIHLVSLYALPLSALAVIFFWTRLKLSFQILLVGFAFAFFVPILLALCPWSWWGYVEPKLHPGEQPAQYFRLMAEGVLEGVAYLVTLLPTVLSLIPGVQRACLRVKTLLPESMLPGWLLVSASPFYALFLLVAFVAVNQVASDPIFLIGMFLFLAAPLVYVLRADVFTSPLMSDEDYRRMRRVQGTVGAITMLAGFLLVTYLTRQSVFGIHLVGLDRAKSLLHPLDLGEYFLEFIGRSMFMTVLGADLFMRMNLTSWKHTRALEGSQESAAYDRVMGSMELVAS